MVQYKVLLTPQVLTHGIKNTDNTTNTDYTYVKFLPLQEMASEVYIRRIRFTMGIDHITKAKKLLFHPYQFHIRWMDGYRRVELESGVLLNSMYHYTGSPENIGVERIDDTLYPSYSTFVTMHSGVQNLEEPQSSDPSGSVLYEGKVDFYYYDMERNDLIRDGRIFELNFEAYFTNLGGKRYYRHMPNVEIDFEVL